MSKSLLLAAGILLSTAATAQQPNSSFAGPDPTTAPDGAVIQTWTQITGNDSSTHELTGFGRFIVASTKGQKACDAFTVTTSDTKATPTITARTNAAPKQFPITVCEFKFDQSWTSASLYAESKPVALFFGGAWARFPTLYSVGSRTPDQISMVSIGDSGCRNNRDQQCGSFEWPFQAIAEQAATLSPDVVLHLGDYRYANKNSNDSWHLWYQELFYPAQRLLLESPWITVRGNHERCGYDNFTAVDAPWGTGWNLFLQPLDAASSLQCPAKITNGTPDPTGYQPPYAVDIEPWYPFSDGDYSNRFVILDTSSNTDITSLQTNFTTSIGSTYQKENVWWASHRPIWGVNPYPPVTSEDNNLDESLTSAMNAYGYGPVDPCWTEEYLPCTLRTVISGHIHNLEQVQFFWGGTGKDADNWQRPMQYVSGNSGVVLNPVMNASPCTFTVPQSDSKKYGANLTATVDWENHHGFTFWQRGQGFYGQSGWQETRYLYDGSNWETKVPQDVSSTSSQTTCASY